MDAITALHTRVSAALLGDPAPDEEQLEAILRAGLRAADHGRLRPWRFLRIEGSGRERLAELFLQASLADDATMDEAAQEKVRSKPFRAPLILVAIASVTDDPQVPALEQIISAGATVQNMMNACHALGVGAMWRTGSLTYHRVVKAGLGVAEEDTIVGFLYMGKARGRAKRVPQLDIDEFVTRWPEG